MYLLYLDDAGSPGNPAEEYFVLGGVCVYEAQVDWFSRELDKLATPYDKNPEDVEFHASTIFSRRADPWKSLTIDDARGVLKAVLKVTENSYDTMRLFACAIHKHSYPSTDPVEMAFEDLCQRFDYFLMRRRQQGDQQRGMIILDKTTRETSLQRLSREFRKVGTRWGSLKNIADTPFFVDSKASRLIQLADHVAYSVFRRYNSGDAQYMDIIANRFDEADGVIHGLSHKHNFRDTCTCPGCLSRRLGRTGEPVK
ncbi:MAG: DUF3800 domain-containing protein [Bryobacterales bacterium]|nr:DUF3800 domain-containing protein [Bryobacterales bacterium]